MEITYLLCALHDEDYFGPGTEVNTNDDTLYTRETKDPAVVCAWKSAADWIEVSLPNGDCLTVYNSNKGRWHCMRADIPASFEPFMPAVCVALNVSTVERV